MDPTQAPQADKLAALMDPATYGAGAAGVRCIETHFAWVFLAGESVYKLKKPIRAPDLDLETLEQRHRNCSEELRLNRELSPEVYLGLVKLVRRTDGTLGLREGEGEGEALDWLVRMRRLPEDQMLDRTLAEHRVPGDGLDAAARVLISFYRRQQPVEITPEAYVRRMHDQVADNRTQLRMKDLGLDRTLVDEVCRCQLEALDGLAGALADRAREQRIIEVHGDLRPEHVCLAPPALIDRLEFSRDLRVMDPCEELAYFYVECRAAGAAWIGDRVTALYAEMTGDTLPGTLYRFYQSHRAATRGKIIAWHVRDPEFEVRQPWSDIATQYPRASLERLVAGSATG